MAKHKLTPEMEARKFKKGVSGNPNGRPVLNPVQKAMRELTIESLQEVIRTALTGNIQALKSLAENPDTPALQVGVATAIMKAIKEGNPEVLERFAARIVGKIPDIVHVTTNSNVNINARIISVSDLEIKARLKKIRSDV